jgi:hypothetical protein
MRTNHEVGPQGYNLASLAGHVYNSLTPDNRPLSGASVKLRCRGRHADPASPADQQKPLFVVAEMLIGYVTFRR